MMSLYTEIEDRFGLRCDTQYEVHYADGFRDDHVSLEDMIFESDAYPATARPIPNPDNIHIRFVWGECGLEIEDETP